MKTQGIIQSERIRNLRLFSIAGDYQRCVRGSNIYTYWHIVIHTGTLIVLWCKKVCCLLFHYTSQYTTELRPRLRPVFSTWLLVISRQTHVIFYQITIWRLVIFLCKGTILEKILSNNRTRIWTRKICAMLLQRKQGWLKQKLKKPLMLLLKS